MRVRGLARAVAQLAAVAGASAIAGSCTLPGTTLGTYDVKGTLALDTCGGAPNPWAFSVMLSEEAMTLYWNWEDASPMLSGPITDADHAALTGYQVANVDTTDAGTMGPCDLQRNDDLVVTLGSGSPPGSLEGTLTYTFSAQEGANCQDQLSASGGTYERLPCTIRYAIAATRQ
jgi:hypothetical protein